MTQVVSDQQSLFLANGNKIKQMEPSKDNIILNSPELCKRLQDYKEELVREKQFSDLIIHVIEKIEKEGEQSSDNDLWPEFSLLDMKRYIKEGISVSGVSESSPVFVLESVDSKIGNTLHNFNIFEICQLAECTKVEIDNIANQANSLQSSDIESAVQDAKNTLRILSIAEKDAGKDKKSWSSWGNITQVSNLLHIRQNTKKIASLLNPKSIGSSLVEVFVGHEQDSEDFEDLDSFQAI